MNFKFLLKAMLPKSIHKGQSILEYILICALIAVALIAVISLLKLALRDKFEYIQTLLSGKAPPLISSNNDSTDSSNPKKEQSPSSTPSASVSEATPLASVSETTPEPTVDPLYTPLPEIKLQTKIRDFKEEHIDFEVSGTYMKGLVKDKLGSNGKPVYNGSPSTSWLINSAESFNQWYNDVPGINKSTTVPIVLKDKGKKTRSYVNKSFFPIDNMLFGNEKNNHNYYFTAEINSSFKYKGGEVFTFSGDDDVWIFVNNMLVIDLGGIHAEMSETITLDNIASKVGLKTGGTYKLDIFYAERHVVGSDMSIETTLELATAH